MSPTRLYIAKPSKLSIGWLSAIWRLLFAGIVFILVIRFVDVANLVGRIGRSTAIAVVLGIILLLLQTALFTARWRLLVKLPARPPDFWPSFWACLEGAFLNQAIPSTVAGDTARIVRWRADGMGTSRAFASVWMDRLSGGTGAAIMATFGAFLLMERHYPRYLTLPILALSLSSVALSVMFIVLARWDGAMGVLRSFEGVYSFFERLRTSLVTGRRYLLSLGYSVTGHIISALAVYAVARSLSIDVPVLLLFAITCIVLLVSMVPISFAGWGLREASFLTLLAPLNVSSEDAVLIGILFGLICLVAALPGGLSLIFDWGRAVQPRVTDSTIAGGRGRRRRPERTQTPGPSHEGDATRLS